MSFRGEGRTSAWVMSAAVLLAALTPGRAHPQDAPAGPPSPVQQQQEVASGQIRPAAVSPALFEAVSRATGEHPAVRSSQSSARAASADVRAAQNLQYPSLSVQGVALGTGPGLGSQIVVDQPVYSFGKLSATIDRAKAQRMVREGQVDETVLTLARDTIEAYFQVARLATRETILKESSSEHEELVQSIGRRVEQEVSPQTDLELARSRAAQIEQELSMTSAQRLAALARLRQLVGDESYNPGFVPHYDPTLHHPDPDGAMQQAVACSPVRARLQAEALVAQAETRQAKRAIWPQLSAQFSYNDIIGARAGLAVTAQTSGGLSNLAAADAARARESAAQIDILTAERELRERVNNDLVENAAARRRIASGGQAAESARNVTASFQRQFVAGRRTWLDVMNAVREASTARLGQSEAEFSAMASAARLLLETCRWQPQPRLLGTLQ